MERRSKLLQEKECQKNKNREKREYKRGEKNIEYMKIKRFKKEKRERVIIF